MSRAEVLAERERLIAADALIPRRKQRPCPNCSATSVRVDWAVCCWNPPGPVPEFGQTGGA